MGHSWAFWTAVLTVADVLLASAVTMHAVLRKRDSRAVIGWVGLAWLAPFVGALAYYCLGINRIERKAVRLKLDADWTQKRVVDLSPERVVQRTALARAYPNLVGLAVAGRSLSGRLAVPGNRVEPLIDGDEAYPAMIQSIREAKRSVSLLSYIFDSDRAGDAFLDALVGAQDRSVQVRVLVDDVGSKYSRLPILGRPKKAGLTAASFLPTRVPRLPQYANLRNHRKILVVDGVNGFTGGTNIREGHWL